MSRSLHTSVEDLRATLSTEREAWATWRDVAANARSAAVMGSSVARHLRFSGEYGVRDLVDSDQVLTHMIARAEHSEPGLRQRIEDLMSWAFQESERGIIHDLTLNDPKMTLDEVENARRDLECEKSRREKTAASDAKLRALLLEADALVATRGVTGMSETRKRVIDTHTEHTRFIVDKARQLAFSDSATAEIEQAITELKSRPGINARRVYNSSEFADLERERKRVETDRSHTELTLQAYFDHHSQGASRTESAKVERVSLKLPSNLEKRKSGYELITAMDDYTVGRGNEMWAIIPDLRRVAHDIDPINHMHWQPPVEESEIPMEVRKYRKDQNRILAKTGEFNNPASSGHHPPQRMHTMAKAIAEREARLTQRRKADDVNAREFDPTFRSMQAKILREKVEPVMLIHGNLNRHDAEQGEREDLVKE